MDMMLIEYLEVQKKREKEKHTLPTKRQKKTAHPRWERELLHLNSNIWLYWPIKYKKKKNVIFLEQLNSIQQWIFFFFRMDYEFEFN